MDKKKARKATKSGTAVAAKNLPVKGESAKSVRGGIQIKKRTDTASTDLFLKC